MGSFMDLLSSMETTASLKILIIAGISIVFGILAGNGAVSVFNRLPASWLCDYGEEPAGELKQKGVQRIKSHPWKAAFSMLFVTAAIKMAIVDWQYAAAALASLWALLIIAIADKKYMIIPDQFVIMLALTAFGYAPYHADFLSPLWGALIGGGCMLLIGVTGRFILKKTALGFGDVKLLASVGLIAGPLGVSVILVLSSFLSCVGFTIGLLRKKVKRADFQALGPYIAFSTAVYLVFL